MTDEPRLTLPTFRLLAATVAAAVLVVAAWAAVGLAVHRSGLYGWVAGLAGAVTIVTGGLANLVTLPWIPRPASTAGLAWVAASLLRFVAAAACGILLYSVPPSGWSEDLAVAKAPFMFAVATGFLLAMLLEVAVIARHVTRAASPR
ncbi:MAG: hypothetical protein U0575_03895 [Phycisphaerales bacterium]